MKSAILADARLQGTFAPIGGYYQPGSNTAASSFESFASNALGFFTIIAGIFFLIMFILGGLSWISAGGDSGKVDKAKSQLTNAAVGLIVVISAYSISYIIGEVLGISILNPASFFSTQIQ